MMTMKGCNMLLLGTLFLSAVTGAVEDQQVYDKHLEGARAIFNWIAASKDGIVNAKHEVQRAIPGDINSRLIVAAKERIEPGEVIVRVPWDLIIEPDDPDDDGQLPCTTVTSLAREMRLGEKSTYAPYVTYLLDEDYTTIPSAWSEPAQRLMREVVGHSEIPPARATIHLRKMYKRCDIDPNDEFARKAAIMIITRSDDTILIP
jgi:hypothetical protein